MSRTVGIAAVALLFAGFGRAQDGVQSVTITLRDRALVNRHCVRLADIAELQGGPEALRRQLGELDIDDLAATEVQAHRCSRTQIQYRLRLAGIPPQLFRITGAREVLLVPDRRPLSAERIIEAAKEELYRRLRWSPDEVAVKSPSSVGVPLPAAAEDERVEFEVEPHRPVVGPGKAQMDVTIRVNGEKRLALPVTFDVQLIQEVAVCRRWIAQGELLTENDLFRERRPIGPNDGRLARPEAVIGRRVRRPLSAGQAILATDVDGAGDGTMLVRAGQPVRLTVKLGAIDVVCVGEAMQNGAQGQLIRVRNVDSKTIITGRVTGPKTVEVEAGQ